jgi:hypothetical protein
MLLSEHAEAAARFLLRRGVRRPPVRPAAERLPVPASRSSSPTLTFSVLSSLSRMTLSGPLSCSEGVAIDHRTKRVTILTGLPFELHDDVTRFEPASADGPVRTT